MLHSLEDEGVLTHDGDRWLVGDLNTARIPVLVREVIEGRLARLTDETRGLLEIAAVIGHEVPIALWQQEHNFAIEFMTDVSLNVAQDPELLTLMKEAHFSTIFVGIESPRVSSLKEAGKMQNTRGDLVESEVAGEGSGPERGGGN